MRSNIAITAAKETGLLSKVAVLLIKKGFRIHRQTISEQADEQSCLLYFEIESQQELTNTDIAQLEAELPGLVTLRQDSATGPDMRARLDEYGKQLISQYPGIRDTLQKCVDELPASSKAELLARLGQGLGRWRFRKDYALGGLLSLDKTLQRMLWPSLDDFLDIEADGNRLDVRDCPVCASHIGAGEQCHFVAAYIEGFLGELTHLPPTRVVQSAAAAAGSPHCSFEVRGDAG